MPRVLLPIVALALVLSGCGTGSTPDPTPSLSSSAIDGASPEPSPEPGPSVPPLPANAFLQISVTAISEDGSELDIVLTVDQPVAGSGASVDLGTLADACPNAIASQLDVYPQLEPTGVVSATISATGDWGAGDRATISAGSFIANVGQGDNIAPVEDPASGFGCTAALLTGPGEARLLSLLLGDPATDDQVDADIEMRHGVYGIEDASDSASTLTWRNCRIQLSEGAQLIADQSGWYYPEDWGRGCLIGYGGSA